MLSEMTENHIHTLEIMETSAWPGSCDGRRGFGGDDFQAKY